MLHPEPSSATNSNVALLNAALARAQKNFKPITKSKTANVKGRTKGGSDYNFEYKYADLADCLAATLPALNTEEICLRQPIRFDPKRGGMLLVTELHHSSGQFVVDDGIPLPGYSDPQAFGADQAYARRQAYCSLAGIAPEEGEDKGVVGNKVQREKDQRAAESRTPQAKEAQAQAAVQQDMTPIAADEAQHLKDELKRTGRKASQLYEFIGQKAGSNIPASKYQALVNWFKEPQPPADVKACFDTLDWTPYERSAFAQKHEHDWATIKQQLDAMIGERDAKEGGLFVK